MNNDQNNQEQIEKTLKVAKIAEIATIDESSIMENKRRLAIKKMAAGESIMNTVHRNAETVLPAVYIQSMQQPEKVDVKLQLKVTAKDNDLRQKEKEAQDEEMTKQLETQTLADARASNEMRLKEELRRREAAGSGVFSGNVGGKKSHLIRNVAIAGGVFTAASVTSLTAFPLFFGQS